MKKIAFIITFFLVFTQSPVTSDVNDGNHTLHIGAGHIPDPILPWEFGWENKVITSAIFSPLYNLDKNGNLLPELADGLPKLVGGEIHVTLKEGVKFSDGSVLSSEDVVFTYKLNLLPIIRSDFYFLLKDILNNDSISAIDEKTIRFVPEFFGFYQNRILTIPIVSEQIYGDDYEICSQGTCPYNQFDDDPVIGTGPFILEDLNRDLLVMTKNYGYWDAEFVFF